MLPLITVLEAPPPKSRTPVDDDTEEELDENPAPENKVGVCTTGILLWCSSFKSAESSIFIISKC